MSASGKAQWEQLFERKVRGFRKVRLNDIEQVERAITANTVAVMLEPIQGEAGVFVASDAFLRDLRALTKRHGILLILDEIQTGIGRTGTLFGFQHAAVEPDLMVLAKGLGGGIPLGLSRTRTLAVSRTGTRAARSMVMRSPRPWDARFWRRLPSRAFSLASPRLVRISPSG